MDSVPPPSPPHAGTKGGALPILMPSAWADVAIRPGSSAQCVTCGGQQFWGNSAGWRCECCIPAYPGAAVERVDTRETVPA